MSLITIETVCGRITGTEQDGVCLFRGIPYAVTKRFGLPEPVPAWDELNAADLPVDCWQYLAFREESSGPDAFYHREFRPDGTYRFDESPMTLNIVAAKEAKGQPVLVFIHGGGFETGTVGELPYGDCREYAGRGIVFVSLGYRLNVFSLYEGGNYGLHDMIFGLKWIKEHIAAFGGDPERITVMGQSAGAMSIMDLLYSQALKGIVKGAVCMSGGGMVPKLAKPWTKKESLPFWAGVRKRAGAGSPDEFKALPADRIWNAWYDESRESWSFQAVQPSIDGTVIPKLPQDVAREGSYLDIPMIVGVTSQDFMPYVIFEMAYGWAKLHARQGKAPVWGYMFDRALPGNSYKAFHGSDLWYMFGNMDRSWRPFEKADFALKDMMVSYVAQFVKNGDPNGGGLPAWPSVTKTQHKFRLLDGKSDGLISPMKCRLKEYHSFLRDKGPM